MKTTLTIEQLEKLYEHLVNPDLHQDISSNDTIYSKFAFVDILADIVEAIRTHQFVPKDISTK